MLSLGLVILCALSSLQLLSCEEQQQPAAASAPIYVSFTRWENRTFSPRVYYYILVNQRPININGFTANANQTSWPKLPLALQNNNLGSRGASPTFTPVVALASTPSLAPSQPPIQQIQDDNDDEEEELDPNDLDFFATRLNTPRPGSSKSKAKVKPTSIQFPSSDGQGTYDTRPPPPEFLQQYNPVTVTSASFAFPTTSLVFSNATDKKKVSAGAENETPEKSVDFYIKQFPEDENQPLFSPRRTAVLTSTQVPQPGKTSVSPASAEEIEIDSYGLTFAIYRASKGDWKGNNVLFSPLSFLNVMAVLLLGANGTTFNELANRLQPSDPSAIVRNEPAYHSSFQRLLHVLDTGSGPNVALDIFNGLFVDSAFQLRPEFRQSALDLYSATTHSFDFGRNGEEFKKKVNELVAFKTRDKIKTVLDGPVDPTTTLALINTIYFRGSWEKPFIAAITKKRPFYPNSNGTDPLQIDTMTNVLTVPYLETPNYRVVGLPYKGNKTGFFIILPSKPGVQGLQEMEARLTVQDFYAMFSMKATQVTIQLPKMRVEGADSEAKQLFKRLGLGSLFDPRTADLTRISNTSGLYIKSIVHKAILDLDESGTEAAAATVVTGDRILGDSPPVQFNVNRPFAFCILHVQAKTVLFMGRVTRPSPLPNTGIPLALEPRQRQPQRQPKRSSFAN